MINRHDCQPEFLPINHQTDKFFSRLLSKERSSSSKGESSFRFFYYGDSSKSSIPFRWESQPGTPKHALSAASLPPLTPPPSYQSSGGRSSSRHNKFSLPFSFSMHSSKKPKNSIDPTLSTSSCSSSFSQSSAVLTGRRHRSRSDLQLRIEEIYGDAADEDQSSFGGHGRTSEKNSKSLRGYRSWLCLRNA